VNLVLGVLRPTEGSIRTDGEPVTDATPRAWQNTLGYMPQDIFLILKSPWVRTRTSLADARRQSPS
jgi:ABC-type multidrug transport system fused ATPase/permease subunit